MHSILKNNGNLPWRKGPRELLSVEQFRALVLHECARCDRNSHQFSLVEVELPGRGKDKKEIAVSLARKILKRIRATDEAGWLGEKSLGVFLPETGRAGAEIFAKDVFPDYAYQVYTYPDIAPAGKAAGDCPSERTLSWRRSQRTGDARGNVPDGKDSEHSVEPATPARVSITQDLEAVVHPGGAPWWKRAIDITGASIILALLSPLFLVVAAYIKMVSPGPVFFRQERVGYLGRPFKIYKFRTMKADADQEVHQNHLKDLIHGDRVLTKLDEKKDSRLIPLAGLLRKSCVDELPQLINVLKGEMSLVGPRPLLSYEAEEFAAWQRQRMHTLPGMTGLWQVSGKNLLTFSQMMRLDARYSRKAGFGMDFLIFLKTIPAILGQITGSLRGKIKCPERREARKGSVWNRSVSDLVRQFFL